MHRERDRHKKTKRNDRPKIAYILKRFPRLSETFVANEILALERKGFDITIFSMKDPSDPIHAFVKEIGSPVVYLPRASKMNYRRFLWPHLYSLMKQPKQYVHCLLYARNHGSKESMKKFLLAGYVSRSILAWKIDHIHSHFASGSTRLAKYIHLITGVPFSFTAHAKDIFSDRVSKKQLQRRMEKATFVVTISDYNRGYLKKVFDNTNIHVVRNGIPVKHFTFNGDRAQDQKTPVILSVGRFVEKKGFTYLIDACGELKRQGVNFRCLIVGDGPLRAAIESRIRELDLKDFVRLEGTKTQEELVSDYYRRASIFVLPCKKARNEDMDGIPVVLEEAMAMGIPVVTTPIAGIPELVRHLQTGILTQPEDSVELSRSIRLLLSNKPLRDRLRHSARLHIEREYDLELSSRQLADLFRGKNNGG